MANSDFANETRFKILTEFANRMGIEVVLTYRKNMRDDVLAYYDVHAREDGYHKYIIMLNDFDEYAKHGKDPFLTLGHEIIHPLIEDFYRDDKLYNTVSCPPILLMLENDCSRMGLALCLLAERIADREDELSEQKVFLESLGDDKYPKLIAYFKSLSGNDLSENIAFMQSLSEEDLSKYLEGLENQIPQEPDKIITDNINHDDNGELF